MSSLRLIVTTPTAIAVDEHSVRHVGAEDPSGAFGIKPGHADFLTSLSICVVRWRNGEASTTSLCAAACCASVRASSWR